MPYFIYKILPSVSKLVKNFEKIEDFAKYREAKQRVSELRIQPDADKDSSYRIIFAENVLEAEERLQEKRPDTVVREWEK